jgi:Uma2 family endonuclease
MSAQIRPTPLSLEAFLNWEARQAHKHEFVDGVIIAMAGASKRHNLIAANILASLHAKLPGKPCRPFGSDAKLLSPTGNVRYPDVQVDCARLSSTDTHTTDPRVVVEVLSPSNDWVDVAKRRADYQAHESVTHILFIASMKVLAQSFTREGAGWREEVLETLEEGFDLSAIDAHLTMAEIYEGATFELEAG